MFLGFIGEIDPDIADDYGIGDRCYAAELDFDILSKESSLDKKYKPLPKHPAIVRDIAVVVVNTRFHQIPSGSELWFLHMAAQVRQPMQRSKSITIPSFIVHHPSLY